MKCTDCDVTWNEYKSSNECWNCGRTIEKPKTNPNPPMGWPLYPLIVPRDAVQDQGGTRGE